MSSVLPLRTSSTTARNSTPMRITPPLVQQTHSVSGFLHRWSANMATFKINADANLTEAETAWLQETFKKLEAKIEEAKILEKAAVDYFDALRNIGVEMYELHKYSEDFKVDGHEIWVDRDNYYNAARAVNRFWIP